MSNMKRLAAIVGFVAIAASLGACSEVRPWTSAEMQAYQAERGGPR
jgi:hypothetical protein